jgi:hypothetical protein
MLRAGLKAYIPVAEIYISVYLVILLLFFNFIFMKNFYLGVHSVYMKSVRHNLNISHSHYVCIC